MNSTEKNVFNLQHEDKTLSGFWMNWMTGYCAAVALFGIVLAGGAFDTTSGPVNMVFGVMNGPVEFNPPMHFSLAVLGAVSIGWSITMLAAVRAANLLDKQSGRPVWIMITSSVVTWYLIDSTLSVATGFGFNAIPNTLFMAAFLIPVFYCGLLRS